jgi:hypothetical protein
MPGPMGSLHGHTPMWCIPESVQMALHRAHIRIPRRNDKGDPGFELGTSWSELMHSLTAPVHT